MKNIIERIAGGGAKIAGYLSIAVKSRLAVAALAALAAGGAWAATLSYSGYISTDSANPTTVFSGVNLSDIGSTYVLKGNMGGANIAAPGEAGVYNASLDSGVLTVQFQKIDGTSGDTWAKCVVVKLQQSGDDITAYASATAYNNTLVLGRDFSSASGTPVSSASAAGYGIYDLSLVAGRKLEYKTTWSNKSTGNAAQPFWRLKIPTSSTLDQDTLVKISDVKIGSRASSWSANYDSAYMCVIDQNSERIYSSQLTGYAANLKLASTASETVPALVYSFPDSTPVMVEAGDTYNVEFLKADKTYTSDSRNPGGAKVVAFNSANDSCAVNMQTYFEKNTYYPVSEVEVLVVATATASADANWSALTWTNGAADWTAAGATPVVLTVSENCTITLDSAVSLESIVFDIADGKTLTLAGNYTITAPNGIIVKGGTVAVSAANLVGTVYGDGELKFVGIRPTTTATNPSLVLTDSAWEGTVTIQYNYRDAATGTGRRLFPQAWGSANSKIKWNGVAGYFGGCTSAAGWILEDLTVNDTTYPALRKNDGGSDSTTTAPALSGTGTFADASNPSERFRFTDGSGFSGSIDITSSDGNGMNVQFGETAVAKVARTIHVLKGATVTVAAGKTWTAPGGMVVSGTLIVVSGATVPTITTTDTASYVFGANATIGTVSGYSLGSSLFITAGIVSVTDTSVSSLVIPAQLSLTYYNEGTLDLSACTSLSEILLDNGSAASATIGTLNLPTPAPAIYMRRADGAVTTATVTGTTAAPDVAGAVKIDGFATAYDVTFTNTYAMAYYHSYAKVSANGAGDKFYNNSDSDKTTGLYLYKTPWIGDGGNNLSDLANIQDCMTLAVVGQMPSVQADAMFIHLGGCSTASNVKGFLIARMAEDNKVRVAYNNGKTVTTLTTMTVPNASTARHTYIITKVDTDSSTTFTIYLDGIKWKTVALDSVLAISGGVQVGSDFHGEIHPATQTDTDGTQYVIKSISSSSNPASGYVTDTTGYVNCIRLYDRILTQAEIKQYSDPSEYSYVSPNGSAVRTFTAASEDWIDETEGSDVWSNTKDEVTTTSGTPAAGAALTVNTDVATTIGVNLAANTSYEAITVNGTGATFQFDGESTGKITVTGSSVIGAPTTIVAGALDISGGPVTMTEDGSLMFDYSNYEVTSATAIQLTGPIARNDSAVTITVPTNPYYTYTAGWDTSSEQYVITPTANAAVLIHGGTQTGYATFAAALADAVSGDTIDLTANVSTDSLSFEGSLTLTSSSAVTFTASGSIVLPTAASTLSVNGVTLSPAPTTTVAGSYVKATTAEGVTTYSVCANPSVSDVAFSYGADFATADVTATVSDTSASYTLTVGQNRYSGTVSGTTVTFSDVATGHATAYDTVGYAITVTDAGSAQIDVTGGSGTSVAANVVAANWINENATTHGQQAAGGSWTNAEAVTYSEGKAAITDNRFEATTASTASRVVLEFNVCFSSVSDANVDGTAQAAIKIGEVESAATFMVLAQGGGWTPVFNDALTPDPAKTNKVVMTIDYGGSGSYGVAVDNYVMTNASGFASFPLAASKTSVQTIDFAGSGTLTSMKGDQVEGYMVKDNAGNWYATIQAAIQAYNSANGPYTVLHDGTAPSGWKIDETTKALIKLAKGFFFMAY